MEEEGKEVDIRAPNTTRVVRALFKVQDEDRPVEFFSPLSRPPTFFFSAQEKHGVHYEYYAP